MGKTRHSATFEVEGRDYEEVENKAYRVLNSYFPDLMEWKCSITSHAQADGKWTAWVQGWVK